MIQENKYLRWLSGETQSIYWHDSAICAEQEIAFGNGAVGMTTNPFLVNSTIHGDAGFWRDRVTKVDQALTGDAKAAALIHMVTGYYAEKVRGVYEKGMPGKGYVCAQTNPNKTGNYEYMVKQAAELAAWAPNIVVKLPATNAGIKALTECAAKGLNVAATVSFTVPQVLAVAEAAKAGKARAAAAGIKPGLSIAVLMVGRLDDYLRDVAQDSYPAVKESDVIQAGTACIKRAYGIFNERKYDTFLMPAGCRGGYHISELAGARMIMSIAPKIADKLTDDLPREERIGVPVAKDVIERLMTMPEFRKAYEPDGMQPSEFITFGSANRTTDQFINDGWNPLEAYRY